MFWGVLSLSVSVFAVLGFCSVFLGLFWVSFLWSPILCIIAVFVKFSLCHAEMKFVVYFHSTSISVSYVYVKIPKYCSGTALVY